jgi:hypothetical protein
VPEENESEEEEEEPEKENRVLTQNTVILPQIPNPITLLPEVCRQWETSTTISPSLSSLYWMYLG